jgi:hypothetical protein
MEKNIVKYTTWNIRTLIHKEGELERRNTTETKRKLKGMKETENFVLICSGVNKTTSVEAGIMIWIHKALRKK